MRKIEFDLSEIASFMEKIQVFIPKEWGGFENINRLVENAFILDHVPDDEILEMTSSCKTIEDAIDEYWTPGLLGSHKDKAAIRRMIKLAKTKSDLVLIFSHIEPVLTPEGFEFKLFLRRAAEIL